jgi:hypothetical protein
VIHRMRYVHGRPRAQVIRAYVEDGLPQHTAARWFVDEGERFAMVAAGAPGCVPHAELIEEAEATAASYRLLQAPGEARERAPTKPWWRLW